MARDLELLPQTEEAIYAPKIAAAELELDFNDDAESLARRVAAFAPKPGARATIRGARLKILAAQALAQPPQTAAAAFAQAAPGEILPGGGENALVKCGVGALAISRLQRSGKNAQTAPDFLRGFALAPGARFE